MDPVVRRRSRRPVRPRPSERRGPPPAPGTHARWRRSGSSRWPRGRHRRGPRPRHRAARRSGRRRCRPRGSPGAPSARAVKGSVTAGSCFQLHVDQGGGCGGRLSRLRGDRGQHVAHVPDDLALRDQERPVRARSGPARDGRGHRLRSAPQPRPGPLRAAAVSMERTIARGTPANRSAPWSMPGATRSPTKGFSPRASSRPS